MGYILDVAVILLFVLAIFIGYKRGFVKSIVRVVGCLLALVIAGSLSSVVAGGIYDAFLADTVTDQIAGQIPAADTASIKEGLSAVMDKLPQSVVNALGNYNLDSPDAIVDSLEGTLTGDVHQIAATLSEKVVRPIAVLLLSMVCFFVLFILLVIVVLILAHVIGKVFKLPGLKQINGVLGAVLGVVEGVLWVLVAVTIVHFVALSSPADALISQASLDNSLLVKHLDAINPVVGFMDRAVDTLMASLSLS